MPEYMLSVHHVVGEPIPRSDEMERMFADVGAFNERVREAGAWVFAGGLMPRDIATTVDNTGDAPVLNDGPFAETKEWLGGFWIIDVADLDEAAVVSPAECSARRRRAA